MASFSDSQDFCVAGRFPRASVRSVGPIGVRQGNVMREVSVDDLAKEPIRRRSRSTVVGPERYPCRGSRSRLPGSDESALDGAAPVCGGPDRTKPGGALRPPGLAGSLPWAHFIDAGAVWPVRLAVRALFGWNSWTFGLRGRCLTLLFRYLVAPKRVSEQFGRMHSWNVVRACYDRCRKSRFIQT